VERVEWMFVFKAAAYNLIRLPRLLASKRCGGDGAGFELTIGAAADPAAKPLGW
jgi:hypothetical protein